MTKKKTLLFLNLAFVFLLIIGCAGNKDARLKQLNYEVATKSQAEKLNDRMLKNSIMSNVDPSADYIIGPDDLLDIEVFEVTDLKRSVRVSSRGYIGLPLIGQVTAKGRTPVQLEHEIAQKLEKFIQEPIVSVSVKEYKAQRIGVMGAVKSPLVYSVTGQRYLLEMLSIAGGLTTDAGNICYILRPSGNENGKGTLTETIVIDLNELLENGNIALNVPILSGDIINIPKGGMIFVDGAVARPGAFQLQKKATLVQAIALAGGFRYEADKSDIKIFRDNGKGEREPININYNSITDGKQADIPVQENDIIIATTSGLKSLINSVTLGVPGLFSISRGGGQ